MESKSWVIVRIADNVAMFETWNKALIAAVNTQKYKVVPIYKYLCDLNSSIKESNHA